MLKLIKLPLIAKRNIEFSAVFFGLNDPIAFLEIVVSKLSRFLANLLKVI